jgi:hypothetical protein
VSGASFGSAGYGALEASRGVFVFGHIARMSFIVWSTPHDGAADEYNRWYNDVHLPDSIANGSFTAMHRYEVVGPGYRAASYLSIAEADYGTEAEAWASVRPRAQALHAAKRIDDLYRVDFATMLLTVESDVSSHPVETLTTVQNDWRVPGGDAQQWLASLTVPPASRRSMQLFTTDPDGARGAGLHLALFESATSLDETVAMWKGTGEAGMSPVPPYTTIFGVAGVQAADQPDPASAWVAHWRHLVTVGR